MRQTDKNDDNTLTRLPIPGLIWKVATPASIGFFFHTMFNVTDTWFAGRMSTEALAALSLSFPIFFIILSLGSGFATGATALVGDAFGAENRRQAAEFAIHAVISGLLASGFFTMMGLIACPTLFRWLGASNTYLETSLDYMNVIFSGTVFFMMSFTFNGILNALGESRPNRNFLIVAFFVNVLLDPWFIFGGFGLPALGISGVAAATVLCEMGGAIYLGVKAFRSGLFSNFKVNSFRLRATPIIEILRQGLPASFSTATVGIGIFIITYFVGLFGQVPVAGYGIAVRIEQIVLLPTIGLNVATLAIVSQNSGANLGYRVQETMRLAIRYGGRIMLPAGFFVILFAKWLMALFTQDPEVIRAGATYLRVDAMVLWAYVILFVNKSALQGMKQPMFSVWIGLYRQIFAPAVVFWVFAVFFDFRLWGIWWGVFGVTWSAAIYSYFYANRAIRKIFPPISRKF